MSRDHHCTPARASLHLKKNKNRVEVWVWWLTPIIPALWEAKAGGLFVSKSLRPAYLMAETPSILIIQKLAGLGGMHL